MSDITKIKFKYKYAETYNPVFITGVHGGFSSRNMFVLNFFQERYPVPKSITYEVEDNKIGSVLDTEPKQEDDTANIIRFFETGITCTLETAIELRDFLSAQIIEMDKNKEDDRNA